MWSLMEFLLCMRRVREGGGRLGDRVLIAYCVCLAAYMFFIKQKVAWLIVDAVLRNRYLVLQKSGLPGSRGSPEGMRCA